MEYIQTYFPYLTDQQKAQFQQLLPLYREWNEKINVISRKDIDNIYLHHVLHSLAIARLLSFEKNAEILDLGTGGGFPGIPLAILFPETNFTLIDGTGKKIQVVSEVATALGLQNVKALHRRGEEMPPQPAYDFIVSRAVAGLDKLYEWSRRLVRKKSKHPLPNGWLILKGGDIEAETALLPKNVFTETFPITDFFKDPYFKEKYIVYMR
jgi:16S rRNA (guanine527-N7)-methyltransferase